MPSVSESIRASGWRQGSVVRRDDAGPMLAESIDQIPSADGEPFRLIVVTQDCDLVSEPHIEPFVELILCKEIAEVQPLYQNGRNPRLLHIKSIGSQGPAPWLEISIHDRFRVRKEALVNLNADAATRLEPHDVRLLSRWIAKRYTRPAFADAFNQRLETVGKKLEKLFKSEAGGIVTGIFLDVADDEHPPDTPYGIGVWITAKADAWDDDRSREMLDRFEERFSEIVDDCKGIDIIGDDIRVIPEEDLTLADLRQLKRLDKDYRSLPGREGVEQPADGGGEL